MSKLVIVDDELNPKPKKINQRKLKHLLKKTNLKERLKDLKVIEWVPFTIKENKDE